MATYSVTNFIKTPVQGDKKLFIYDASGNLMYVLEPLDVNFFYRNNKVVIHQLRTRIERESCRDHSYAELDFASESEAQQAMNDANTAKNLILTFTDYYNTTEIDEKFQNLSTEMDSNFLSASTIFQSTTEDTITIYAGDWSGTTSCTIFVPSITTISLNDIVFMSILDQENWALFGLFALEEVIINGEQRFISATTPTSDISIKIRIIK